MNEQAERVPRTLSARGQALLPVTPWREARESQDRVEVDHVSMHALRRLACHQPASAEPSGPPTPTRGRLMPWAKLDDRFHENRKVRRLWRSQPAAVGLHVLAITYCAGNLTDGIVDAEFVEERVPDGRRRKAMTDALVASNLWRTCNEGWSINDYTEFNPSRKEVQTRRAVRAEAGKKGATARWGDGTCHDDGMANADGLPFAGNAPDPTRPEPDPTYEADADASPSRRRLSASSKEVAKASEDDKRLCRLFADLATKRNEKAKVGSYAEWLRSMRLMREQDGHTPDEIERAIRWLFEDKCDDAQFWSSTIQAPSGLREHFAQVWAKLQRPVRAARDPQQAAVDADRQAAMRRLRGAA